MTKRIRGISKRCMNILPRQPGVCSQERFLIGALAHFANDQLDSIARSTNHGFPQHDFGIYFDPIVNCHFAFLR
jgi:hypothetical protein